MPSSTTPLTRSAESWKRPCGELTATARPTSSLVWSLAIRWIVCPSGMSRRGYRRAARPEKPSSNRVVVVRSAQREDDRRERDARQQDDQRTDVHRTDHAFGV